MQDNFTSLIAFWAFKDSWWELQKETTKLLFSNVTHHKQNWSRTVNRKWNYLERIAKINEENDFGSWNQRK